MSRKADIEGMRGKDSRELRYDLETARKGLFSARFQMPNESAKPSDIGNLRRRVARILTILEERGESDER